MPEACIPLLPRSAACLHHCTPDAWVTEFLPQVTKFKWRQYQCPRAQTRVALMNSNFRKFPILQLPLFQGEKERGVGLADC